MIDTNKILELLQLARNVKNPPAIPRIREKEQGDWDFRCSEIWGCPRKLYFTRIQPREIENTGSMDAGTACHDYFQTRLRIARPDAMFEREIMIESDKYDLRIHGSYDMKLENSILDFKTCHPFSFKGIVDAKEPAPEHWPQLQAYMIGAQVDQGFLAYIDRANYDNTCIVPITRNPLQFEGVLIKLKRVKTALKEKIVPKGEPKAPWECEYCQYQEGCPEFKTKTELSPPKEKKPRKKKEEAS